MGPSVTSEIYSLLVAQQFLGVFNLVVHNPYSQEYYISFPFNFKHCQRTEMRMNYELILITTNEVNDFLKRIRIETNAFN